MVIVSSLINYPQSTHLPTPWFNTVTSEVAPPEPLHLKNNCNLVFATGSIVPSTIAPNDWFAATTLFIQSAEPPVPRVPEVLAIAAQFVEEVALRPHSTLANQFIKFSVPHVKAKPIPVVVAAA